MKFIDLNVFCFSNGTFEFIDANIDCLRGCFVHTYLLIPTFLLFALINGFVLGVKKDLSRRFQPLSLKLHRFASTCSLITILVQIFYKYLANDTSNQAEDYLNYLELISQSFKLVAVSLHFVVVLNKNVLSSAYPPILIGSLFSVIVASVIETFNYAFIIWSSKRPNESTLAENVNACLLIAFDLSLFINLLVVLANYTNICRKQRGNEQSERSNDETSSFESFAFLKEHDECEEEMRENADSNQVPTFVSEEDMASYASYLTFSWLNSLLNRGYDLAIRSVDDLCKLPIDLNIKEVSNRFFKSYFQKTYQLNYNKNPIIDPALLRSEEFITNNLINYEDAQVEREVQVKVVNPSRNGPISLLKPLLFSFGREFFLLGVYKFINDMLNFSGPLLLNQLVQFVETRDSSLKTGVSYATALFFCSLIASIINIHFTNSLNKLCLRMRTALIALIYRKSVLVKFNSLNKFSIGQIVNFMSIDTNSIVNGFPSFHSCWSLPLQISITLYFLYSQIGISFVVGVVFVLLLIPVNKFLSDYIGRVQKLLMQYKDERVKVITEFLQGIRVIKFCSWEKYFLSRIDVAREKELNNLRTKKYLDAGCVYFWASTPILMSVFTFITYVLLGNTLTPSKVFTSLALFNMLIAPLNAFPWVINGLVQSWVSLKRLQSYLSLKNLDWLSFYTFDELESNEWLFEIRNGEFKWKIEDADQSVSNPVHTEPEVDQTTPTISNNESVLSEVNLKVKKGQLVAVIGKIGSGKSSLLNAIMAEIDKVQGKVRINPLMCSDGFAYLGQENWIQTNSIRENILFGSEMDPDFYDQVLDACALKADLKLFPKGDETPVGENGICLSGGQRARLCLARACYARKEIYILDDPFSAVDAHVANHINKHCINELLANKTRIISTHHFKHVANADLMIVVENGRIVRSGPGQEIIKDYMKLYDLSTSNTGNDSYVSLDDEKLENVAESRLNEIVPGSDSLRKRKISERRESPNAQTKSEQEDKEEEKEHGVIDLHVYKYYCYSIGICLSLLTVLALFLMQASRNLTDFWLSYWTEHHHSNLNATLNAHHKKVSFLNSTYFYYYYYELSTIQNQTEEENETNKFFLYYGFLCFLNTIFTLFRAFLFAYSGIRAGKRIHTCLMTNISKASLRFFDNTPRGRILNRLSTDMYTIDDSLPFILNIFLACLFGLLGILVVTCYSLPWFTVSLIPLSILYYSIQNYYRWTSRELKRLSSISLSPIYTHFHETISGIITIRAFRQIDKFYAKNEHCLNKFIQAEYNSLATSQWLNFRLQMISVLMITIVGFTAVFQHIYATANASLIGLALSYIMSVTGLLNGLITSFTETEKELVSVERALQFENIESEQWSGDLPRDNRSWLNTPKIEFKDVVLKYKNDANNALDGVNLRIEAGEKIGICGRTGSGKSSLFMSLFRGTELHSGSIWIDNVNIRDLDLELLRQEMSIIPQDPFLFAGTLRENLDPSDSKRDDELWQALRKCRLDEKFRQHVEGLNWLVEEKGKNLSTGEKQLICLARAILSNRKILCIDEATASVDLETDNLVQQAIRNEFSNVTVLTIAHRINTIFDYDKIIVMSNGQVAEFDTVNNLVANRNSIFYSLLNEKENSLTVTK